MFRHHEVFFHRFGFGSNFIRRHISDNGYGFSSGYRCSFPRKNLIASFGFDIRSFSQGLKTKTKIFKNKKRFPTPPWRSAKVGRKLPETLSIVVGYSNMVGSMLRILGSFLLRLCVVESKTASKSPPGS